MKFLVSLFIFILSLQINAIEIMMDISNNVTAEQAENLQPMQKTLAKIFVSSPLTPLNIIIDLNSIIDPSQKYEKRYCISDLNLKIIKYLVIEGRVNLNFNITVHESIHKFTPLMLAILLNNFDLVKLFVENGANINIEIENNRALLFASKFNTKIAKYLIENGAAININNDEDDRKILSSVVGEHGIKKALHIHECIQAKMQNILPKEIIKLIIEYYSVPILE